MPAIKEAAITMPLAALIPEALFCLLTEVEAATKEPLVGEEEGEEKVETDAGREEALEAD